MASVHRLKVVLPLHCARPDGGAVTK